MLCVLPVLLVLSLPSVSTLPAAGRPPADDGNAAEGAAFALIAEQEAGGQSAGEAGAAVEGLAWLAGCWVSEAEGTTTEECWLRPRDGQMLGLNRSWKEGRKGAFEFLRIAAEEGRVVYWASPGGRPPTGFTLSGSGRRYAVFENPGHDFPQRIHYWMAEDGRLHARVEADTAGGSHGFELVFESGESPCEQASAPEAAAEP